MYTVAEAQRLTQEYASFSQSRSGLGNVLGGVVGLMVFGIVWMLSPGVLMAGLACGLTVAWLVGKEVIRGKVYRRFGQAREVWPAAARRTHIIGVGILALCLAAFAIWIIVAGWLTRPVGWPYLLFCLATPWIAWRYLRTLNELMVGFGLLFICAITASGHQPFLWALLIVPTYALALIGVGLTEHHQFQALAARLHAPREAQP